MFFICFSLSLFSNFLNSCDTDLLFIHVNSQILIFVAVLCGLLGNFNFDCFRCFKRSCWTLIKNAVISGILSYPY